MAIKAYSCASGAVLAPVSYVMLVWAVLIDPLWFGNWPRAAAWIGSAALVGTGLYVWHRERLRAAAAKRDS
jgi:S-adenosylmethionine uptake transporter